MRYLFLFILFLPFTSCAQPAENGTAGIAKTANTETGTDRHGAALPDVADTELEEGKPGSADMAALNQTGKKNRIVVLGATGSLAKYVIEAAKPLGNIELTLFVRDKSKLSDDLARNTRVVVGDALDYNDVREAVKGHDIVYVNLAGDLETMGKNIVRAMQETGVKRIVAISSIGIYETPLKPVLVPYRKLADMIESSGLDYTILRPEWFTYADEVDYALTRKGEPETGEAVSRKSIAAFVVTVFKDPKLHKNQNLGISKPSR